MSQAQEETYRTQGSFSWPTLCRVHFLTHSRGKQRGFCWIKSAASSQKLMPKKITEGTCVMKKSWRSVRKLSKHPGGRRCLADEVGRTTLLPKIQSYILTKLQYWTNLDFPEIWGPISLPKSYLLGWGRCNLTRYIGSLGVSNIPILFTVIEWRSLLKELSFSKRQDPPSKKKQDETVCTNFGWSRNSWQWNCLISFVG